MKKNINSFALSVLVSSMSLALSGCGGSSDKHPTVNSESAAFADNSQATTTATPASPTLSAAPSTPAADSRPIPTSAKPITSAMQGQEYAYRPDFGHWNNNPNVTFSIKNQPKWASFDQKTAVLSGIGERQHGLAEEGGLGWLDTVEFDVEIIAELAGQTKTTKPFNIVIVNEDNKIVTRHLVLSAKFAESTTGITEAEINKNYRQAEAYIEDLSNNKHDIIFAIVHIAPVTKTAAQIHALHVTQMVLNETFLAHNPNPEYGARCDLEAMIPLAQARYSDKFESYKKQGMDVDALDFSFARTIENGDQCRGQLSSGSIAMHYLTIPEDIDISVYQSLVFNFYDDTYVPWPCASKMSESNRLKQGDKYLPLLPYVINNKFDGNDYGDSLLWIDTGAPSKTTDDFSFTMADYYSAGQIKLTHDESVIAHELIHNLGIGTHDNGLTKFKHDNSVFNQLEEKLTNNTLNGNVYGDNFSVLGGSLFSASLAPSTREYLGWIDSNNITTLESSADNITINDINSKSGYAFAKVKVDSGWLYISYHAGTGYDETLKFIHLKDNMAGIQIRYTDERDL